MLRYIKSKNRGSLLFQVVLLIGAIGLLGSCDGAQETVKMVYVPSVEIIKENFSEFILEEGSIEGLYGNRDVDSMIFKYTLDAGEEKSSTDISDAIVAKAEEGGWQLTERSNMLRFNRFGRPKESSEKTFFSSEEIRVVVFKEIPLIYVGWVQVDTLKPVDHFPETGEGRFAKRVLWPLFQSYIEKGEQEMFPITDEAIENP